MKGFGIVMKDINEDLLTIALGKLTVIDLKDIESIEVRNRRYSDTTTLSIEIDYASKPIVRYNG